MLVCIIMNTLKWIGRKVFYHESLAERQVRKLGKVDIQRALLHNNDEKPIVRPPDYPCLTLRGEGILPPIIGLPPSYEEVVKKTYTNNKKKKRHGKSKK